MLFCIFTTQYFEMMKQIVLLYHLITVVLGCAFLVVAQKAQGKAVSAEQASLLARKYVKLSSNAQADVKAQARAIHSGTVTQPPYYIFNDAQGQGFVVIAADDAMGQVLAYGTEAPLDTLTANPSVKWLLNGYRQTYEALQQGAIAVPYAPCRSSKALFTKTVQPLLKSKWGQGHPFNAKTGYPYSGCVATAVAQMMYYYQWPAQGTGKAEYKVNYYDEMKRADFSQSHYDWANMLPSYLYPVHATTEQEDAVALLMNDVGVASFMQYTPAASGTQGVFAYQALQKHFSYTAAYVTRAVEGASRFAEILRKELLNGCPVYLEGRPAGAASGHAWVADGFDENGLFHMNFGWEGQGDAYYSLTNLNVTETGSEFQGKPLAFNRAITAILAHPNNGQYPDIDRALLETSPQLMFNEGGSFTLKEATGNSFAPSQSITVMLNSFVNRGLPFKGDIGVAVYDEAGQLQRVSYSDYHTNGGLTQHIYGTTNEGFMGTDYLINQPQPITISLAGLANGYYRLVPVCAALNNDGTWDAFLPIKKAPIIEVELDEGAGRITETCTDEAHFQLMAQPRLAADAEQGAKVHAFFTIKNLNGVPRDCYLGVQLLDASQTVVLDARANVPTEIEGFTEAEIPITLSLPAHLAPARYKLRLMLWADAAETQPYPINNIHDKDAAYITVTEAQARPLMDRVEVFLADDANDKIASGSVDMNKMSLFKLAVALRTTDGQSYDGPVTLYSEDVVTGEKEPLPGFGDRVFVSSSFDVPLFSYWLRKVNVPWAEAHTYRIVVMGLIDEQEVELNSPQAPAYYLKRESDVITLFQGFVTSTEGVTAAQQPFTVHREGHVLTVSAHGLLSLRLYDMAGHQLKQCSSADACHASLSLQGMKQEPYLLRIETAKHTYAYRFIGINGL